MNLNKKFWLTSLILISPAIGFGQNYKSTYPSQNKLLGMVRVDDPSGWAVFTSNFEPIDLILLDGDETKGYKVCAFEGPPGTYGVLQQKLGKLQPTIHRVVLGGTNPIPPNPPNPDPNPPNPPPIPSTDLWVLFVRQTEKPLNREQDIVFGSTKIIDYLNKKCGRNGGRPTWRKFDLDQDTSFETNEWKEFWTKVKPSITSLPAMVVRGKAANGEYQTVVYGIQSEQQILDILKGYGG